MEIKIKRIDPTLPLPEYQTDGAVAFDLYSREDMTIEPKTVARIPANFIIETPPGYVLLVASRSSTPGRKGLLPPHGIGIVDGDYCGPEDEVMALVYNFSDTPVQITRGERVAQALFVPAPKVTFKEVETITEKSRGGFGSTGH